MTATVKLLSNTIALSTANTVFSAKAVYVLNSNSATTLITQNDPVANVQIGTLVVLANQSVTIIKKPTDTLAANSACSATSVAFTN